MLVTEVVLGAVSDVIAEDTDADDDDDACWSVLFAFNCLINRRTPDFFLLGEEKVAADADSAVCDDVVVETADDTVDRSSRTVAMGTDSSTENRDTFGFEAALCS